MGIDSTPLAFLPVILWWFLGGLPTFFILKKTGKSLWWAVVIALPIFGFVVLLWILVFTRWPSRAPT
jgi:hypothetical protein